MKLEHRHHVDRHHQHLSSCLKEVKDDAVARGGEGWRDAAHVSYEEVLVMQTLSPWCRYNGHDNQHHVEVVDRASNERQIKSNEGR